MPTENNWLYSNLSDRLEDHSLDFKVFLSPIPITKMSFEKAAIESAFKIANKYDRLFLAFSGGLDSEFILLLLKELKIEVTPLIINFQANAKEFNIAIEICKKLNIEPVILYFSEQDFFNEYLKRIFIPLNGIGINGTPFVLCKEYAAKHHAALISGEHMIDDDPFLLKVSMAEWDFYNDVVHNDAQSVGLLTYTPNIVYSIVKNFDGFSVQKTKSKLYNITERLKYKPEYNKNISSLYNRLISKRKYKPASTMILGYRDEFLKVLEG